MSGYSILVVAVVFGILDHETCVIGYLEPLHASYQLCSAWREGEGVVEVCVCDSMIDLITIFLRTLARG